MVTLGCSTRRSSKPMPLSPLAGLIAPRKRWVGNPTRTHRVSKHWMESEIVLTGEGSSLRYDRRQPARRDWMLPTGLKRFKGQGRPVSLTVSLIRSRYTRLLSKPVSPSDKYLKNRLSGPSIQETMEAPAIKRLSRSNVGPFYYRSGALKDVLLLSDPRGRLGVSARGIINDWLLTR